MPDGACLESKCSDKLSGVEISSVPPCVIDVMVTYVFAKDNIRARISYRAPKFYLPFNSKG